ncbi:LamG domain-containing protein, partial [candidate division KSB1 bacterium]|nr:LamG domain-containing protein [candidate division KSB1 bacterium]
MKSSRMFVCIMLFLSSTVFVGRLIGDVPEPIAHYTFDAGAEDVTGNGFDGTITGDVYFEDGFMYLDGDDDVVDIPSIGTFNEITITMWVNSDVDLEPIQFAGGFNTHNWVTGAVHFKLNYGLLNVGISGFGPDVVGVTPVYPGEWSHIALTVSLTEVALYLNGFLEAIVEVTVPQDLIIGDATIGGWNLDREWTGLMDDVRIYDLPLTEEEII